METGQTDFWRSLQHEAYMFSLNNGGEYDWAPASVKINGTIYPYTTCVHTGVSEPFKGALLRFPDYKKVVTGSLEGFQYRS